MIGDHDHALCYIMDRGDGDGWDGLYIYIYIFVYHLASSLKSGLFEISISGPLPGPPAELQRVAWRLLTVTAEWCDGDEWQPWVLQLRASGPVWEYTEVVAQHDMCLRGLESGGQFLVRSCELPCVQTPPESLAVPETARDPKLSKRSRLSASERQSVQFTQWASQYFCAALDAL